MIYAFDLDGTLVDSREAVLTAYRSVGVEPPPDFFGKPWREWLTDKSKHEAKNEAYIKLISEGAVKELPLLELYWALEGREYDHSYILTGASIQAVSAVAAKVAINMTRVRYEMSLDDKLSWMRSHGKGIMFEDDAVAARTMRRETGWTVCHMLR